MRGGRFAADFSKSPPHHPKIDVNLSDPENPEKNSPDPPNSLTRAYLPYRKALFAGKRGVAELPWLMVPLRKGPGHGAD